MYTKLIVTSYLLSAFQWEVVPHFGSCNTPSECYIRHVSFDVSVKVFIYVYIYITLRGRHQRLELWYIQVIPRQSRAWGGITEIYYTLPYSVFLLFM